MVLHCTDCQLPGCFYRFLAAFFAMTTSTILEQYVLSVCPQTSSIRHAPLPHHALQAMASKLRECSVQVPKLGFGFSIDFYPE